MRSLSKFAVWVVLVIGHLTAISAEKDALICCAGSEVFIIPSKAGEITDANWMWRWHPDDSPEIQADQKRWFRSCDECKPIGKESILIVSSSGGIALIDRADKKCRFLAFAKNAHSACLLPGNRVAVAASAGGDETLIFQIDPERVFQSEPLARAPLPGGHGAEWDRKRNRLWMLGESKLELIKLTGDHQIVVEKTWELPSPGGHDLSPSKDGKSYFITSNTQVYLFDKATGEFQIEPVLGDFKKVKSVDEHPVSGKIVFHKGTPENWWSETIRFRGSEDTIQIPGKRLYKARWDFPRER